MGYYTDFTLSAEGRGPIYDKMMKQKDKIVFSQGDYDFILGEWLDRGYSQNLKWYDWEKDMKQLSREWPNVLFILEGDGEETGDLWKAWFRNGEMHKLEAKIVFETIKPDLDKHLPYDKDLDKRLGEQYKKELAAEIAKLQAQLDELSQEE
ncbi:hypothetical protein SEA_PARADIDDLES_99 [Streptomyces phage Paradiddles]|uniref:Uncharacterized protein n=1 Tax=Streptomyces phage Paradiddles TaxID=2023993 RepID=A0A222Z0M6_9CAUD|nr:hypothetical protein FDI37_gp153 [Streptomyces phage Paradiddles]ASR77580.1 hypothetical protein SEA_PARADIDDLES_99 [Streptomyces phage Paradiddles]